MLCSEQDEVPALEKLVYWWRDSDNESAEEYTCRVLGRRGKRLRWERMSGGQGHGTLVVHGDHSCGGNI